MTNKLAPAKEYYNRPIHTWTVISFTEYLKDKHREMFGIDYAPHGGRWGYEQSVLGDLIGTQSRKNPKPRTASNADVKRFIDVTFENYQPTPQWPGVNFGWVWTYRKTDWQRIQAESNRKAKAEKASEDVTKNWSEVAEWL